MTTPADASESELHARIAALEAEIEALGAPQTKHSTKGRFSLRAVLSAVLIVVGLVLGTAGLVSAYAKQQLLDTSNFVSSFAPLASSPAVQDVVTTEVVAAIDDAVDIRALTGDVINGIRELGLPPRADAALGLLEAPAAQGLQGLVESSVDTIVRSDAFATVWEQALRISHTQLMATLHDAEGSAITLSDGAVRLQLAPIVAEVKDRLVAEGIGLAAAIPPVDRSIVLVENTSLDQIRTGVLAVETAGTWLPWASLILLAGGVLLARQRRRTLIVAGISLAIVMGTVGVVLAVVRRTLSDAAQRSSGSMTGAALESMFDAATGTIAQLALAIGTLAGALVIIAWLAGTSRIARGVRAATRTATDAARTFGDRHGITTGRVGEWIDAHHRALLIALAAISGAVVLFVRPLSASTIVWTAVLSLIVLVGVQLARRPATEAARSENGQPAQP